MNPDKGIKIFNFIAMFYFGLAFLGAVDHGNFIGGAQSMVAMTYVVISAQVNREDKHTLYLSSY